MGMFERVGVTVGIFALGACKTASLRPEASSVAAGRQPPGPGCSSAGYLTGKGGGTFGGAYVSNESLIEYAMNDLRNQAAELGANYIQHDPPQLGSGDGTTTSVTITGTAYRCPEGAPRGDMAPVAVAAPSAGGGNASAGNASGGGAPASAPPEGAVGFRFGQTREEAGTTCTEAGHQWTAGKSSDFFSCSGTPTALGMPARAVAKFCHNALCAVMVSIHPDPADGQAWADALLGVQKTLEQKYGKPRRSKVVVPQSCNGAKLRECVVSGTAHWDVDWAWPDGEQIHFFVRRPDDEGGPVDVRVVYRKPMPAGRALEGL